MGFGNFLKGIAAQVNPFDNGKTYGSYNRKRREEDENQQPQLTTPRQSSMPTPRQTDNAFQNKTIGGQSFNFNLTPQNQVNVPRKSEYDYSLNVPKPKQSFWNKVRDQFDANTEADKYRRSEYNSTVSSQDRLKPVVQENAPNIAEIATTPVRSALRVTTGIGQGASGLADWVTPGHGQSRFVS